MSYKFYKIFLLFIKIIFLSSLSISCSQFDKVKMRKRGVASNLDTFNISNENKGKNLLSKEESEKVQEVWKEIGDSLIELLKKEKIDLNALLNITEEIEKNLSAHSFGIHCSVLM